MNRTFVIAEMGSSWLFGKGPQAILRNGIKLILTAHNCGANAVKVQWVSDPRAMARRRHFRGDPYRHLRWPIEWHGVLAGFARELWMQYISTVFLPQDVPLLAPFVDRFKVASLECQSRSLKMALSEKAWPLIVSFGCTTRADKRHALWPLNRINLLCTAAYPCPISEVNLRAMRSDPYRRYDGVSDHSGRIETGGFAVAAGANVVEVHCRLAETPKDNPDYGHSHAPESLRQYIANIRLAETMLGDGRKRIMPSERPLMKHRVTR